jgi:nucleoside-diphosphate-sugar epimerase
VFKGGTGARITLNQVLQTLGKIAGKDVTAKYEPARTGDILHSQADITEARKVLGYEPKVNFEQGLRRTWEWYEKTFGKVKAGIPQLTRT